MKTNRKAAVLALGLALLSPLAGAELVDTEWWKVDFTSPTPEGTNEQGAVVGDVELFDGDSVSVLTNTVKSTVGGVTYKPAYASGIWIMADGDESVITNSVVTNALEGTSEESLHIKLDTQGNDLVWAPSNGVPDVVNLVDADLLLVGSDSAPDHEDFDPTNATKRVQTAIFLKNATDEESGETTNSVLCVYSRNTNTGKNEWMELTGDVKIEDNSWHHVQVSIDYTGDSPIVVVKVDDKTMTPVSGVEITAANPTESKAAAKVQEVCFRGTGAVDNFVGTVQTEIPDFFDFTAEVYMDGELVPADSSAANKTIVLADQEVKTNSKFSYEDFTFDNWVTANEPATWCLEKVDVVDVVTSNVTTYTYSYAGSGNIRITADEPTDNPVSFPTRKVGAIKSQTGSFTLEVPTEGATGDMVVAKIYFKTIGAFYANAVTEIGDNVATNGTLLKPVAAGGTYPTNLVWTFPATDGANVLTGVKVENGATATYDSATRVATATVTLATALETTKTFVTATYAEGSYEGKTPTWIDNKDGTYVLGNYVAKIDGDPKPVYYTTLQSAIDAVPTDGTETKVKLLADIATKSVVAEGQNVFLDLGGFSITTTNDDGIENKGTLALTNGTITARWSAVYNTGDGASLVVWDGTYESTGDVAFSIHQAASNVSITVHGGTITSQEACIAIYGGGSLPVADRSSGNRITVTGGTLTSRDNAVIMTNGTEGQGDNVVTVTGGRLVGGIQSAGNIACGIYLANNDTLTFGGDAEIVVTGGAGIVARAGAARIGVEGGTITTTGTTTGKVGDAATALPCAAIVYDTSAGYPGLGENASLTVTGGTFVSDVDPIVQIKREGDATILAVSGGSFSDVVPAEYCAPGFVPVTTQDENGRYTVKLGAIQVGTDTYGAFADAIPVHGWGATYTLLTNVEETVTITNAAEKLFVEVGDDADRTNGLEVVTTVEGDAQYAYTVKATLENGVVTYELEQTIRSYDVVWHVEAAESTNQVAYGATPVYPGATPTKDQDDANTYAFDGWAATAGGEKLDPLPAVTGPTNFYAVFAATPRKYTITWTMDDDSVIDTTTVAYGATPTHADPTKASTAEFSYEFAGWSPEVVEVTGEATYKATFTATTRSYAVTFWTNEVDVGEAWFSTNAPYGTLAAAYAPTNDPTKAATTTTNFTFAGWTNAVAGGETVATADLPAVTGAASWLAVWTETPIWTVTFKNGDDTIYETNYLDGATAEYVDETPTKASTAQYAYTFAGWDPALGAVTADTVYAATFSSNAVEYAIAYDLDGGQWPAGYTPTNSYTVESAEIVLPTPVKDGYAFNGWTNALGAAATGVAAGSTGDQFFGATWEVAALDPVDPGQDMTDQEKIDNPPVAVVTDPVTGDVAFTVHFRGEEGVTYQLVASESCAITEEQWKGEAASGNAVPVGQAKTTDDADQNGIIELVVPMSGDNVPDVRFFKIKATR